MHEDHSEATHSKKCDDESCEYVAKTHAHDDDGAAAALARDLAAHNKETHDKETDAEKITKEVKEKMEKHEH